MISFFRSSASCSHGLGRWTLLFTLLAGEVGWECQGGYQSGSSQESKKKKKKHHSEYLKNLNQDIGHTGSGMAEKPHRHCSSEISRNRKCNCC